MTYYISDGDLSVERDPSLAGSVTSVRTVDNEFVGLTDLDPVTGEPRKQLATDWSVSDDGLTWTFRFRTDVPWVSWNPDTDEARVERFVTAQDIVTAVQRSCNTTLGGSYGPVTLDLRRRMRRGTGVERAYAELDGCSRRESR